MKNKKLIKVIVVMAGALLLFVESLLAQNIGISGTVKDEKGVPVPGISILVKGTTNGALSGTNGDYSLRNVNTNATIVFSCIGYATQEIAVNSRQKIDVVMKEDQLILEELVVVGYGVQKKSHLTGSIAKVNTTGIEDIPVSRLDQALQGKVAGLNIQNTTSEAGMAPTIRVRGMGLHKCQCFTSDCSGRVSHFWWSGAGQFIRCRVNRNS